MRTPTSRLLVVSACALLGLLLQPRGRAAAQTCRRDCPLAQRDAHGCCRTPPPSIPASATRDTAARGPACALFERLSRGHCCPPHQWFDPAENHCVDTGAEQACARRNGDACVALGNAATDPAAAARAFERGCAAGSQQACALFASSLSASDHSPRARARAVQLARRACNANVPEGCRVLGEFYWDGAGVAQDVAGAWGQFDRACGLNYAYGCVRMVELVNNGYLPTMDPARVTEAADRACAMHDSACVWAGIRAQHGTGTTLSLGRAVSLYERACTAGNASGCIMLGVLYGDPGPLHNPALSVAGFQRGCELRAPRACLDVGRAYRNGLGVARDEARGADFLRRACEYATDEHNLIACVELGDAYRDGRGVSRDLARARQSWQRAFDVGHRTDALQRLNDSAAPSAPPAH